jgi:hypothetical protein
MVAPLALVATPAMPPPLFSLPNVLDPKELF